MYTSLYYPHTRIRNENIVKQALFLWDQLEYISPTKGFVNTHAEKWREAGEMMIKPYVPSDDVKELAHDIIIKLANSDLPKWFLFNPTDNNRYEIYPEKLLRKTWRELQRSKLVGPKRSRFYDDYIMSTSFGLTIMAILADVSAGSQKRTITDREDSYAGLTRFITKGLEGDYISNKRISDSQDNLVTVSLELLDIKSLPMEKLINMRKKEFKGDSGYYRTLRHNYVDKIDSYAKRLSSEPRHKGDYDELLRTFRNDMADDYEELAEALEMKSREFLFSKDMGVAIVAAADAFIQPVLSTVLGIGALSGKGPKLYMEKKGIHKKHAMSWLYKTFN